MSNLNQQANIFWGASWDMKKMHRIETWMKSFCRANVGPYISMHVFWECAEIILHGYQKPVRRGEKTPYHIRIELQTLMIYRRVSGTSQKNRSKTSYIYIWKLAFWKLFYESCFFLSFITAHTCSCMTYGSSLCFCLCFKIDFILCFSQHIF